MIYTRFLGYTGNQMFQYAIGRAIALRLGTDVAIDDRRALAKGMGSICNIFDLPHVRPDNMPPSEHENKLRFLLWRYLGSSPKYIREKGLGFDQGFHRWGDDVYLHGYWQSEKYFTDIEKQLRQDFAFPAPTGRNAELSDEIQSGTSISLHVRRGDYLNFSAHTVCSQEYYQAAVKELLGKVEGDPRIYVFSDDPEWARENLKFSVSTEVVDHNSGAADFEDMRLMSLYKHNIIANSSFSWWGAWLNANKQKHVIAPKDWFGDPKMNNPDIAPQQWLRI
jgi:hypothetical protein